MVQRNRCKFIPPPPEDAYSPESFDLRTVLRKQGSRINGRHPRRRNFEINRKYQCPRYGCKKAYGDMSHLNTHRKLKDHGPPLNKAFFMNVVDKMVSQNVSIQAINNS